MTKQIGLLILLFLKLQVNCYCGTWLTKTQSEFLLGQENGLTNTIDSVRLTRGWSSPINILSASSGETCPPSIKTDPSGNPILVFADNSQDFGKLYCVKWNGNEFEDMTGQKSYNAVITSTGDITSASLCFDKQGYPHIAWSQQVKFGNSKICYIEWNGSSWVDVDGVGSESFIAIDFGAVTLSDVSLCIDAQNKPHISFTREGQWDIFYYYWNGSGWSDIGGNANVNYNYGNGRNPSLILDTSGYPWVAWETDPINKPQIYLLKWNGNSWVDSDGDGQESINISNTSGSAFASYLVLDSSSVPHIIWSEDVSGNREIYHLKWNLNLWVDLDGVGRDSINLSNNSTFSSGPSLTFDRNNLLNVAWTDNPVGYRQILFKKWNGALWVDADGEGQESVAVTSNNYNPSSIAIALDQIGNPNIVWINNNENVVYFLRWLSPDSGSYLSQEKSFPSTISWENIIWTSTEPVGTKITFQTRAGNTATADDGTWSVWSASYTVSGAAITSPSARYIQVKANFETSISSETPVLYDFSVNYHYADVSSPTVVSAVRDGLGASVDDEISFSTMTLSANWAGSSDAESGLKGYWYGIGTTAGGVDTKGWTFVGNVTSVSVTGLGLTIGNTYYVSVRAENNAELKSDMATSDGINIRESIVDHYDVTLPETVGTGSPFTVTIKAKNNTNDDISVNTSLILQAVLVGNVNQAGSGILSIGIAGIYNGAGTVAGETYTKAEEIRIKATDGNGKMGLSGTIRVISSQQVALTAGCNPSSIIIGQTSVITAELKDYYGNGIAGSEVRFSIVSGAGTVSPTSGITDSIGRVTAVYTPAVSGSGKVRINVYSGDLSPVTVEIEVSKLITTSGGEITAGNDAGTKLTIPAGVITEPANISLTPEANLSANQAAVYDIKAEKQSGGGRITDLDKPVVLTLHYNVINGKIQNTNVDNAEAVKKLALYYHDGVHWQKVGGTVDSVNQTITAPITHFSKYAVMVADNPSKFKMNRIGPNPFTPNPDGVYDRVHFYFDNPENKEASIKIYDMGGNLVKDIAVTPGVTPYWNGRNNDEALVEGGVYIYYLKVGGDVSKGTIVLAK